ncbi:MAG: sulfatase [Kiritimatiellia bacterium]|nr:sulfatase-like hydrolase/transferase [Lentisphaerota bacterium]
MANQKAMQKPNILFIHAESMDGRTMGCMGHPAMQGVTPNLDALAARGTLFRQAYSSCPVCNPSRASMWSGKHPGYHGCWNNYSGLREHVPTFWTLLEQSPYRHANFGKLDYQWGMHSIRDQVGSWTRTAGILRPTNKMILPTILEEDAHSGDWKKAEQLIGELRQAAAGDKPFFCCMSTGMVHPSFVTTKSYLDRIDPSLIEIPPALRDVSEADHPVDRFVRITKNHARAMAPELALEIRRVYYAMVAELDDVVGKVLRAVDELGLGDNTYIIFSSDHGEMAGEHNQVLKRTMYEPSIHAPLIIAGPDVRRGTICDDVVSLIDIYPTLLDMMRLSYADYAADEAWPQTLDGESLMPQLTGDAPRQRDWAFAEYHGDRCPTGTYMLRRGRWKLLHHVGYAPQLFDLEEDKWEINNLAASRPEIVSELNGILQRNFDCAGLERRARLEDRRRFVEWREGAMKDGTYNATMARIFSGYSRLCIDDYRSWTDADEEIINQWLAQDV